MMAIGFRTVLLVSSYAPLLLLFALLQSFGPGWPSWICAGIGLVSIVALVAMWILARTRLGRDEVDFTGARNRDADVMAYVVSYVVPFAAATNSSDAAARWALALFALLIAALYLRSAVFYVHPLLLLAGVHVYEVNRGDVPAIVLTRRRQLRQTEHLRVVELGQNVYLEAKV